MIPTTSLARLSAAVATLLSLAIASISLAHATPTTKPDGPTKNQSAPAPTSFDAFLKEASLSLRLGDDFVEDDVPETELYGFEKAVRHRQLPMKIYFAIRPIARMQIDYEDPHSNAPEPDHVFPMVFQSLVSRLSKAGQRPSRVYPPEKAKKLFNADWAAASMFDTEAELNSGFKSGLLVAIHKSQRADAYYLFVFDDPKPLKAAIDNALGVLSFTD
ncbi:MAG: hypothetical protein RIC14_13140 [Filomicrobium sp.]